MFWTSRGVPLDFSKHKYLKEIYECQDQEIYFQKVSQSGLTERLMTETLWLADQDNFNSIYFFPNSGNIGDLVKERVDVPMNNSTYLFGIKNNSGSDNMGLKKMSKGFVYFRGSNSLPGITSIAGDAIFVDEVDRMDAENIAYFEKRLGHSKLKWQRWASTPTYAGVGINKLFVETDWRVYMVKCNHCNEWQELDFWKNVDKEREMLVCAKCREQIIPWECDGKWVKTRPENKKTGYFVSRLYSPLLDIKKMIEASEKTDEFSIQQFYNQDLGLTYEPKGQRMTEEELDACKGSYLMGQNLETETLYMGVDVGLRLHYVIRSEKNIIEFGDVKDFLNSEDSLEAKINKYNIRGVVIDALPETRMVNDLINRFPGKVYKNFYTGFSDEKVGDQYWKEDSDESKVNSNRTVGLDVVFAEFRNQKVKLPANFRDNPEIVSHIKSTTRIIDENKGNKKAVYIETGPDHLLHALNYAKLATQVFNYTDPEVFVL